MAHIKGTMVEAVGAVITTDTPVYEWDKTTTPGTTYLRYENTTKAQYIERITSTKTEKTIDTWANRVTATYSPINP